MKASQAIILLIILVSFGIGTYLYPQLPEKMASHWNAQGMVDGYLPKFWGLFLMPLLSLALLALFIVIPIIDPLKENIKEFRKQYDNFVAIIIAFLFYIYLLTLFWNMSMRFNIVQFLSPAFAAIFYYAGVLMENAKRNWSIGIRTPWTLSSETVWKKTHAIGAKLFKFAGLFALFGIIFPDYAIIPIIIPVIASAVYLVVYSYLEYKKETKQK